MPHESRRIRQIDLAILTVLIVGALALAVVTTDTGSVSEGTTESPAR